MGADFLMFDFETLSNVAREAPIVSIGAIAGKWEDVGLDKMDSMIKESFYAAISTKEQLTPEYGAVRSQSTIEWWMKQSDEAKKVFTDPNKISVFDFPKLFTEYCKSKNVNKNTTVLIRAPHFDFTIIDFHFSKQNVQLPFNHWKVRDVRTIIDVCCGVDDGYVPGFKEYMQRSGIVAHNAVHDCVKDLVQVKMSLTQDFSSIQ